MSTVHQPACIALKAQEQAFRLTYPDACVYCGGKGHVETSGTGQFQACGDCLEDGVCPRCGGTSIVSQWQEEGTYRLCTACEWDEQLALAPGAEGYGMVAPSWQCVCTVAP